MMMGVTGHCWIIIMANISTRSLPRTLCPLLAIISKAHFAHNRRLNENNIINSSQTLCMQIEFTVLHSFGLRWAPPPPPHRKTNLPICSAETRRKCLNTSLKESFIQLQQLPNLLHFSPSNLFRSSVLATIPSHHRQQMNWRQKLLSPLPPERIWIMAAGHPRRITITLERNNWGAPSMPDKRLLLLLIHLNGFTTTTTRTELKWQSSQIISSTSAVVFGVCVCREERKGSQLDWRN